MCAKKESCASLTFYWVPRITCFSRSHFHLHQEYILATYLRVIGTCAKIRFSIRCAAITREFSSITSHSRIYTRAPKYNQHLWETAQIMDRLCVLGPYFNWRQVYFIIFMTRFFYSTGVRQQLSDGKEAIAANQQVNE